MIFFRPEPAFLYEYHTIGTGARTSPNRNPPAVFPILFPKAALFSPGAAQRCKSDRKRKNLSVFYRVKARQTG